MKFVPAAVPFVLTKRVGSPATPALKPADPAIACVTAPVSPSTSAPAGMALVQATFRLSMNPLSIPHAELASNTPTINKDTRWRTFFQAFLLDPMRVPGYQDGITAINKIPDIDMFVKDRNVAMFGYLSGLIYVWEEQLKQFDWDIVSLPTLEGQRGVGSQSYPTYFGLTNMARNKDASMNALKYLISD